MYFLCNQYAHDRTLTPEDQKLSLLRKLPIGIYITRGLDFVCECDCVGVCMYAWQQPTHGVQSRGKRPHKAPSYHRCNLTPKRNCEKVPTTVLINTALTNICWSRFKFMMYCILNRSVCTNLPHLPGNNII